MIDIRTERHSSAGSDIELFRRTESAVLNSFYGRTLKNVGLAGVAVEAARVAPRTANTDIAVQLQVAFTRDASRERSRACRLDKKAFVVDFVEQFDFFERVFKINRAAAAIVTVSIEE